MTNTTPPTAKNQGSAATFAKHGEARLRADHLVIEYVGGPSPYLWIGTPEGKFVGAGATGGRTQRDESTYPGAAVRRRSRQLGCPLDLVAVVMGGRGRPDLDQHTAALLPDGEGVSLRQEANRPGDATNAPGHDTEGGASMPDKLTTIRECVYCGRQRRFADDPVPATHRARWTLYGGATKTVYLCDKHAAVARGQRGIELEKWPLSA